MKFKPIPIEKKKHGEGNQNWIGARFELDPAEAKAFHEMRMKERLNVNQLVKQMVRHCIKER